MKSLYALLLISFTIFTQISCANNMVSKSPQEIIEMTNKEFSYNKELIFKSTLTMLQSEGFLVQNSDLNTGMIIAMRRIENSNAYIHQLLIGASLDAELLKVNILIDEINTEKSIVKLTIYEGIESTVDYNETISEKMVYENSIYNNWFTNIQNAIELRLTR